MIIRRIRTAKIQTDPGCFPARIVVLEIQKGENLMTEDLGFEPDEKFTEIWEMAKRMEGLYEMPSRLFKINVDGEEYLFVGSEADANMTRNDLAEEINDPDLDRTTMEEIKL